MVKNKNGFQSSKMSLEDHHRYSFHAPQPDGEETDRSISCRIATPAAEMETEGAPLLRDPLWLMGSRVGRDPAILLAVVMGLVLVWASLAVRRGLQWAWWTPRRLERVLRQQGIPGTPYRLLVGDLSDLTRLNNEARSRPMQAFSHDIAPRIYPLIHQSIAKHGKICYTWLGPYPRVIVNDPEMIRDILSNKLGHFGKAKFNPFQDLVISGLVSHEGDKWANHRRIITPAFHVEKLKCMLPAFATCCDELVNRWERLTAGLDGSCEMDVWPEFQNFSGDVISRTAFGSSFEEGRRIFQLQAEQTVLLVQSFQKIFIPGYRFLPTKSNRRMREIEGEVRRLLRNMIMKREKSMELGSSRSDDLLALLLEANLKYFKENGRIEEEKFKMSTEDVIDECKLFYFAGQETTAVLLTWTMVLLGMHPSWQARAREEVLQVFGKTKPDFDSLSKLKVVSMILNEVLRLYPPVLFLPRIANKTTELGGFKFPSGVHLFLPILSVHHDPTFWGEDANEFNPERFAGGVLKASRHQMAFMPFGGGPRICVGQSFALLEAKLGLAMILQLFSFEISPSYQHAPYSVLTLHPQHGAQLILRKLS